MRRFPVIGVAALAIAAAAAGSTAVRVTVKPTKALAGERITVSARVAGASRRCVARMTPGGTALPPRRAARGRVAWAWAIPVAAKAGPGTARVTCAKAGQGSARFVIRALPAGDATAGKTTFLLNCGGCHTLADAGTTGTSVDLDQTKPSFGTTVDRVINGKGLMPSFRTRLTPQQIADVASYVSSVAEK